MCGKLVTFLTAPYSMDRAAIRSLRKDAKSELFLPVTKCLEWDARLGAVNESFSGEASSTLVERG